MRVEDRVAAENSSDTDGYVQQLVEHYLDHDAWLRQKVKKGLEQLDRANTSHTKRKEMESSGWSIRKMEIRW
jgi:hypothetical protein